MLLTDILRRTLFECKIWFSPELYIRRWFSQSTVFIFSAAQLLGLALGFNRTGLTLLLQWR